VKSGLDQPYRPSAAHRQPHESCTTFAAAGFLQKMEKAARKLPFLQLKSTQPIHPNAGRFSVYVLSEKNT